MNSMSSHENHGLARWNEGMRAGAGVESELARRRVLAPLVRALRELSLGSQVSTATALGVFDSTLRHPELVSAVGRFAAPIERARQQLQEAFDEVGPFRRRELAELCSQLEGFCASTAVAEHDDTLAYWSTAALRWAARTERPVSDELLRSLSRFQGANENVDVLIAHVCRDPRRWLEAMRCFGRAVHRTGPLARRMT